MLGVSLGSEEVGYFQAKFGNALDVFHVGELTLGVAAGIEAVEALAEVGALAVFHERHIGRLREGEEELSLAPFLLGELGGFGHYAFGKPREVVGCEPYLIGVQFFEHVLPELGGQFRQFRAEFAVLLAVGSLEIGAGEREAVVGLLQEGLLLGGELQGVASVVNSFDALP